MIVLPKLSFCDYIYTCAGLHFFYPHISEKSKAMYSINKEEYGFRLVFGGSISADEMIHFRLESVRALVGAEKDFGLVLDLRDFRAEELEPEARQEMADGIELYRRAGVYRVCYILGSGALTAQYRRRQRESRTKHHERYINAETNLLWPFTASKWVADGIEPGD